ncbi:hypothetical protein DB88DRAFT_330673 [Papiliotrema laurentii]|uniref:Uncharacterized protein n=1 Tax=Papiliotrema laurentii TaxID=5418 RepID=A0AAD9CVX3_PAPLA|nr:hypothetical protein DB88DRAFT_330673 [Papiliotrema laurentii]
MNPTGAISSAYPAAATAGPSRPAAQPDAYQQIFSEFESYPFTDDPDFKAGLPTVINSIRGAKRSAAQIDEMIGRAQWFYFTRRKGLDIPWEVYAQHSASPAPLRNSEATPPNTSPSTTGSHPEPPRRPTDPATAMGGLAEARRMMIQDNTPTMPGREGESGMSFAMLCRLISDGRAAEVPGIQQIPDQLNALPPSQSTMAARPKPWERPQTSPAGTTALFADPPLAPSPPAFAFAPFGGDPSPGLEGMTPNPGALPVSSYSHRIVSPQPPSHMQSSPSDSSGEPTAQALADYSFANQYGLRNDDQRPGGGEGSQFEPSPHQFYGF